MKTLGTKRRRDIGRQRWQFVAVLVAVVLGVTLFAGSFNAYINLTSSLEATNQRLAMADMTVTGADESFLESVKTVDGVATAIERRQIDGPFEIGEYSFIGRAVGMPADQQPAVNKIDIDEGTYLDADNSSGVVIETHAASDFEVEVGDTILIAGAEAEVVGIATSPEYLWPAKDSQNLFTAPKTFGVVFVSESHLEDLAGPAVIEQVLVLYDEEVEPEVVDDRVESSVNSTDGVDTQPLAEQPSNQTINMEIQGLRTVAIALPILFLAAAGMAIYVVITRLVYSQRGVIGTLRASGFGKTSMSRHYRSYGVSVGLVGAAIGAVLGGLMGRGMTAIYTGVFGIPDLVAEFHLPTVIIALIFGLVAGVLASVPPARAVARLAPAEAMRGDSPAEGGKRSFFETVFPPLRRAPVRWRMTMRGIGRKKSRSFAMVLGVILGLVLIMSSWGMMDTMLLGMDQQFNEVVLEDATAVFTVPVGDEQVAEVASVSGVEHAESAIGLQATVSHSGESYGTSLEGYHRGTKVHGFENGLPASGVLLGRAMEDLLGVEVGDPVDIDLPALETVLRTEVAGFVDEPMSTLAYMEFAVLTEDLANASEPISEEVLALPSFTTVKSVFNDSQSREAVFNGIDRLDDVAVVVDTQALKDLIDEFQIFFYVFIGMMLIFGGAMAFALIFNIVSVNVAERAGEFASMRANGLTHRKVASLIAGENFLLTTMGIIPGLFIGYLAAFALMNSFSSPEFPLTAQLRPMSYVGAAAAMFVVAGLSLIPAIRAIKRINVGEIVRERAV